MRNKEKKLTVNFEAIEIQDLPVIVRERNRVPETLRTPYFLNMKMQQDYFDNVLSNRTSSTRYFKFVIDGRFVGYGGIENIQWENSTGELSILIFSPFRGKGYGKECVKCILEFAFKNLNLVTVWGECYHCGNIDFWNSLFKEGGLSYVIKQATLNKRKYYGGRYWDSLYFSIEEKA